MTVGRIPSVEGGIQPTIFDAKGDLLTATANDTPARLAVGANNTVLIADSAEATGLKWGGGWTTWTPTLSNLTLGNGTLDARYQQIGKTVTLYFGFTLGSTSSVGSDPQFSLPITPKYTANWMVPGKIEDSGTGDFQGYGVIFDSRCYMRVLVTSGTYGSANNITATVPMTWATNDKLTWTFTYEAA